MHSIGNHGDQLSRFGFIVVWIMLILLFECLSCYLRIGLSSNNNFDNFSSMVIPSFTPHFSVAMIEHILCLSNQRDTLWDVTTHINHSIGNQLEDQLVRKPIVTG